MDRSIRNQSVARYRRLIESVNEDESVTKDIRRQTIINLLAEELQKQREAGDPN